MLSSLTDVEGNLIVSVGSLRNTVPQIPKRSDAIRWGFRALAD